MVYSIRHRSTWSCKYWLKINNSLIWGFAFVFHSITYCWRPMCKYFHIFYYFFNLSLSITLSRYLYLSFYYIYLQTHVSICLSINLSFYTSIYKSIYQSIINHIRPMGPSVLFSLKVHQLSLRKWFQSCNVIDNGALI